MESILIFGGGLNQLTLIRSAQQLGYKAVVIDPLENAPAKTVADVFKVVAPKDYETTKQVALEYDVKGIVTSQMENPLLLMARLAEELRYRFPSVKAVQNARNKFLMKRCFIRANVPCAKGELITTADEITEDLCQRIGFPLILKPLDSYSSRGVYKLNTFSEVQNYISATQQFSSTGEVILEEFMDGPELSVEGICQNNTTSIIQLTDKVITPYPTAVEMKHIQPSALSEEIQNEIKETVKKAVAALELNDCAIHAEVKLTASGVKMVELGARLGGDYITSHLVPLSTGVNIEAAAIQVAMGKTPVLTPALTKGAAIEYLNLEAGKQIGTIGDYESLKTDGVKELFVFSKVNDVVQPITDSSKRTACVIVQGNTREQASHLATTTCKALQQLITLV